MSHFQLHQYRLFVNDKVNDKGWLTSIKYCLISGEGKHTSTVVPNQMVSGQPDLFDPIVVCMCVVCTCRTKSPSFISKFSFLFVDLSLSLSLIPRTDSHG